MSSKYDITHCEDGWWDVRRKYHFISDFPTREAAEAFIDDLEREDEEAEREAREQDNERE